jgi:hypothetical protein
MQYNTRDTTRQTCELPHQECYRKRANNGILVYTEKRIYGLSRGVTVGVMKPAGFPL